MVTKAIIELDAITLSTIQQALMALQLNAQAALAIVNGQVNAQLRADAEKSSEQSNAELPADR